MSANQLFAEVLFISVIVGFVIVICTASAISDHIQASLTSQGEKGHNGHSH